MSKVQVWQRNFESIGGYADPGLVRGIRITFMNLHNTRAISFDEVKAVEYFGEIVVAQYGNSQTDVIGLDAGGKAAERHELHAVVKDGNQRGSRDIIFSMYNTIEQAFAYRLNGIIPFIDALKPHKC